LAAHLLRRVSFVALVPGQRAWRGKGEKVDNVLSKLGMRLQVTGARAFEPAIVLLWSISVIFPIANNDLPCLIHAINLMATGFQSWAEILVITLQISNAILHSALLL
jgi:hypothetical protein